MESPDCPNCADKKFTPSAADLLYSYEQLPELPPTPDYGPGVSRPPKPAVRFGKHKSKKPGLFLMWNLEDTYNPKNLEEYQLYVLKEAKSNPDKNKNPDTWIKMEDIKALPLPMLASLKTFKDDHIYHFILRAVDKENKVGEFSKPKSVFVKSGGNFWPIHWA